MIHKLKQTGVAALFTTIGILLLMTIATFFTARVVVNDQRLYKNVSDTVLSKNAAQAGFDYAFAYLNDHKFDMTDGQVLTAGSPLSNGATYSVTYTFLTANDPNKIRITAVGVSPNGVSTRTIQAITQLFVEGTVITFPVIVKGNASLRNSANVTNNATGATTTLYLGGTVSIQQSANTVLNGVVSSDKNTIGPDIQQNVSSISSLSDVDFQKTYLGYLLTDFSNFATVTQSFSGNHDFTSSTSSSTQNNWSGQIVYLNMNNGAGTATFNHSFYAGTNEKPVLIVVNGNAILSGSGPNASSVYGSVYATGALTVEASAEPHGFLVGLSSVSVSLGGGSTGIGGIIAGSNGLNLTQNGSVVFSAQALEEARFKQYGIVAGSWRDF